MGDNELEALIIKITGDTVEYKKVLQESIGLTRNAVAAIDGVIGTLGMSFAAVFAVSGVYSAYKEQYDAIKKLDFAIAKMGQTAGVTREEIESLAWQMQVTTNYGDEAVIAAAAAIAKFQEIKGDNFKEAIALSADLAAVTGQDLTGAANTLGRAMINTEFGMRMLWRQGIRVSESAKQQVKDLKALGKEQEAQKVLLDEVSKSVGGMAKEMADPITQLRGLFGDLAEEIGKALIPILKWIAKEAFPVFVEWTPVIAKIVIAVVALTAALKAKAIVLATIQGLAGNWVAIAAGAAAGTAAYLALEKALGRVEAQSQETRDRLAAISAAATDTGLGLTSTSDYEEAYKQLSKIKPLLDNIATHRKLGWDWFSERDMAQRLDDAGTGVRYFNEQLTESQKKAKDLSEIAQKLMDVGDSSQFAQRALGDVRAEIMRLSGAKKIIEEADERIAKAKGTFDEIAKSVKGLGPVLPDIIQQVSDKLREARITEAMKSIDDAIQEVALSTYDMRHGFEGVGAEVRKFEKTLREAGVAEEAIAKKLDEFTKRTQFKKDASLAKDLIKSIETPLDKYRERIGDIKRLLGEGLLTTDQADKLARKAKQEMSPTDLTPKFASGAEAGTQAAFQQILRSLPTSNPNAKLETLASANVTATKEVTKTLKQYNPTKIIPKGV